MVRTGVRYEVVYSLHSGRVLSVLRIVGYSLPTSRVAVYTPYSTCLISDMALWAIVGRSVLASVGRELGLRFVGGAVVTLLLL